MQLDPSQNARRAQFYAGDLLADAERHRRAKLARGDAPRFTMFLQARHWAGATIVHIGERLRGTVPTMPAMPVMPAMPDADVAASPEPQSAM